MTTAQRNRKIKTILAAEFGADKVWVRGDRGTAYGWVNVYLDVPKPEPQLNETGSAYTPEAREFAEKTKARVWELIAAADDVKIGTYGYDHPGSDYGYGSKLSIELRRPYGA